MERVAENVSEIDMKNQKRREKEYPEKGKVYSWTKQMDPLDGHTNAPYILALVEGSKGEDMVLAQLTEVKDRPAIGMEVERVTRKLGTDKSGMVVYGPKYRPANN